MTFLKVIGILSYLPFIAALIISIRKFDKSSSKYYLTFLGLTIVYSLALLFGGKDFNWSLWSFQNGLIVYAGFIWACITTILAWVISIQWLIDWLSIRMGWAINPKTKKIVLIGVVFLCLLLGGSYFYIIYRDLGKDLGDSVELTMEDPMKDQLALVEPLLSFRAKYSKWPKEEEEFKRFNQENKIKCDFTSFQNITFKVNKDGSLKVMFAQKTSAGINNGDFSVPVPSEK